jgi:hypothetical protein
MSEPNPFLTERADQYCQLHHLTRLVECLGGGKDGTVWATTRPSALKIHEQEASYQAERNAYIRLRAVDLKEVAGFKIPHLYQFDDRLRAIEMSIVSRPFIVDFASAFLDTSPDFIEDEGHTLEDFVRERFDDRADVVMGIYYELISRAGIYLTDLHPHNIKFAD